MHTYLPEDTRDRGPIADGRWQEAKAAACGHNVEPVVADFSEAPSEPNFLSILQPQHWSSSLVKYALHKSHPCYK